MARYEIRRDECIHCGACRQYCPEGAIETRDGRAYIRQDICTGCGKCRKACYMLAIRLVEV